MAISDWRAFKPSRAPRHPTVVFDAALVALDGRPGLWESADKSSFSTGANGVTDLIRQAQDGDESAFAALYQAHSGRVHALCLRLAGEAQAARELTQDVFVRVWEALPSFRGESAFTSWLHRLAVNVFLTNRRTSGRRERRVFTLAGPETMESPRESSPEGLRIDLEAAIGLLPEGARTVFVLHDIEGYQHGEIARMIGVAEGTSKAQLFRARRLLREALNR